MLDRHHGQELTNVCRHASHASQLNRLSTNCTQWSVDQDIEQVSTKCPPGIDRYVHQVSIKMSIKGRLNVDRWYRLTLNLDAGLYLHMIQSMLVLVTLQNFYGA